MFVIEHFDSQNGCKMFVVEHFDSKNRCKMFVIEHFDSQNGYKMFVIEHFDYIFDIKTNFARGIVAEPPAIGAKRLCG
jgi:hypothetical protein